MEKFEFYVDRKITDWVREHHWVEAETREEAIEKIMEDFRSGINTMESFDWEEGLEDVRSYIEPGDNDGNPTAELIDPDDMETIIDNIDF